MTTSPEILTINVTGMTCEGCASTVRNALEGTQGVAFAAIDVASGRVDVSADGSVPTGDLEFAIDDAVTRAGYTVAPASA